MKIISAITMAISSSVMLGGCASFSAVKTPDHTSVVQLGSANFINVGTELECESELRVLFFAATRIRPERIYMNFVKNAKLNNKPKAIVNLSMSETYDWYLLGLASRKRLCMSGEIVQFISPVPSEIRTEAKPAPPQAPKNEEQEYGVWDHASE